MKQSQVHMCRHMTDYRYINIINPSLLEPFHELLEGLEAMLWSHWAPIFRSTQHVGGEVA